MRRLDAARWASIAPSSGGEGRAVTTGRVPVDIEKPMAHRSDDFGRLEHCE